jgi:hypothetical protein
MRLMSSSITAAVNTMIKQSAKWRIVEVPDNEDVGVFVGITLFQGVEARRDRRGKSRSTLTLALWC